MVVDMVFILLSSCLWWQKWIMVNIMMILSHVLVMVIAVAPKNKAKISLINNKFLIFCFKKGGNIKTKKNKKIRKLFQSTLSNATFLFLSFFLHFIFFFQDEGVLLNYEMLAKWYSNLQSSQSLNIVMAKKHKCTETWYYQCTDFMI